MTEPPSPGRNEQDVSRRTILDRIAGKWRAKATCVAVERGLPAMLKEGPRATEEVALQPHGEQPKQEALQHLIPACRAALPGVSVAICTYNGAARLPTTLAYLAAQRVFPSVAWEVLVIDNASTDDTAGVVRAAWPPGSPAPLRLVAEPLLGLAHARARAFAEARFEFVSFVDDDNWVGPDWVDTVGEIMSAHADVAACGGDSEAVSEHPLPV